MLCESTFYLVNSPLADIIRFIFIVNYFSFNIQSLTTTTTSILYTYT